MSVFRLLLADGAWFSAVAALALAAGVGADQLLRHPSLGLSYQPAAVRSLKSVTLERASFSIVDLEGLTPLVAKRDVLLLDARPRLFFEMGHLPAARSLSHEEFEADFAILEQELRTTNRALVVYCTDSSCEDGAQVARLLRRRGLANLFVYVGGFAEWEAAGQSVEVEK